jgi:hypothetical protein
MISTLLALFLLQQVYAPTDFVQVQGASLQARYDSAIAQGRRGSDDTFWVAYRFPVRAGIRIQTSDFGTNISIQSSITSDGIEWIPPDNEVQRVGVFIMVNKADGSVNRPRLINLNQNFRVHDRKVYWIGEPNAEESLTLLSKFVTDQNQRYASSFASYMTYHDSTNAGALLARIARDTSLTLGVRTAAINSLSREASRAVADELDRLTNDPNADIQRAAVNAIARRPDDQSIPALIKIATDHPNANVRRTAVQQLGTKRDPRVIDFFEKLLKKG